MKRLVVATRNRGKVAEIERLCEYLVEGGVEICGLDRYEGMPEVEEDGDSFLDNAVIKARAAASFTGEICLSDDSGIVVDVLGGVAGVKSARFGGPDLDDVARYMKLLNMMKKVPTELRTARFMCAVAVAAPDGRLWTTGGKCEGVIATEPLGNEGFGYDPVFFVPELDKTFAQLSMEEKNEISHRAVALKNAKNFLKDAFGI